MPERSRETEEIIQLLSHLLHATKIPDEKEALDKACVEYPEFQNVVDTIVELRAVATSLRQGELDAPISSKGYVMSSIKALQANLHHLVWQLTQVSKGDFSQRIDFLGDFSHSFNEMCERLEGRNLLLLEQARQDGLTKLANRKYLDDYLEDLFEQTRTSDMEFSLMMIDLDFFKQVNDRYGHDIGDAVLGLVAQYLRHVFRTSDFIARFGGEEFVVVLPHVSLEQATIIARRVLEYLSDHPIMIDNETAIQITASIGVTEALPTDESAQQIVKRSDTILYRAKSQGRNRVECS